MYCFQKIENVSQAMLREIGQFRAINYLTGGVLPPDPGFTEGCWLDHYDERPSTIHWMVFDAGELIATARLVIFKSSGEVTQDDWIYPWVSDCKKPFALFGRMVVRSDYRRKGIARTLLRLRVIEASRLGVSCAFGAAIRDGYASSYAKAGFKELTEIIDPSWNTHGEKIHLMQMQPLN